MRKTEKKTNQKLILEHKITKKYIAKRVQNA